MARGVDPDKAVQIELQDYEIWSGDRKNPSAEPLDNLAVSAIRPVSPVDVQIRHLEVQYRSDPSLWSRSATSLSFASGRSSTKAKSTYESIVKGLSADMPAGSLTAIIGSSGSGKTTVLNAISHRVVSKKLEVSGVVTFNGNVDVRTVPSAYVMQQDILLPTLTVRETLQYAADLRLASPAAGTDRIAIVNHVILELGLKACADTKIGSKDQKGCSGGERRRTSIGVQMLANPSVLFCDEPTTGLDAFSAFQVVQTLKRLAERGRTIIIAIHAPRSEIWAIFDRVILLSRGFTLYSGSAAAAISHFHDCGSEMPPFMNPAEFLIDLAAVDNRSEHLERASHARVVMLAEAWQKKPQTLKICHEGSSQVIQVALEDGARNERVDFLRQLQVLTKRSTMVALRDPLGVAGTLLEAILMSLISGLIYLQLGDDLAGIRSREGALYSAATLQSYVILLIEIHRLVFDIKLFDRERNEDAASVSAFLFSRRLSRVLLEDLPVPIIWTIIWYFMVGLRTDAVNFFIFLAVMIISQYISVTLAALCVAISRDFKGASLIGNLLFTLQSFACGYFIQINQISVYMRWLKWVAFVYYTFGALASNEFIGVDGGPLGHFYGCPYSSDEGDLACKQYTGRYVADSLGLPKDWIWRPILVAISFVIVFFVCAGLVLSFWKVEIGVVSVCKKENLYEDAGNQVPRSLHEIRRIWVRLDNYGLDVRTRHLWKPQSTKTILHPISASFEPGKINVIMGPSGSGKTSLLQSLAQRLQGSFFSKCRVSSGKITLNGAVPGPGVMASITSSVTQDDDALMPSLTVRETLRFAAGLRLPSWMSEEEKHQRADEVMIKMGLKNCANRMIGNELKQGISGGEKRRVSIAIQILADPKILLLDEPTSGLDAFLASSVIDVLQTLADEGRTIIITIHQMRSNLFKRIHSVLLLTRDGQVAYCGPGQEMLPHFKDNLGFECPPTTNPADFILDLITVDLQQQHREDASRDKVQQIVKEWEIAQHQSLAHNASTIASPAELSSLKKQMSPFSITFPLILRRSALNTRRNLDTMLARIMQVVGLAIILTLFFAPLKSDYEAVQSRMGFVHPVAAFYFVGVLQNLAIYPSERDTFYHEHDDGCYTSLTFLLSYTVLEVPFEILSALIFGVLATFVVDLGKRTITFFFITALNCLCIVSCGESIGIIFSTIFSSQNTTGFAVQILSTLLSLAASMAGVMSLNIPDFLQAWNHLSPSKYLVANLAAYSMHGQTFSCTAEQEVGGICPVRTGEDALRLYNLDVNAHLNLMALVITTVIYRIAAYGVLRTVKK